MSAERYHGRLELTWTNKDLHLLAHEDGTYEWVPPSDYRVAEVRLLHDVESVGQVASQRHRAKDNLLIRGDALNALTSLGRLPEFGREYLGKVKLAYLDPPFNTQQSFLQYDDALEHSVWLTMMRDRLLQVRELLAQDGSVWVHLDDAEVAYCRVMMDELFGRSNFMGAVIWRAADSSNNDAKRFSVDHNTLLVYAMDPSWRTNPLPRTEEANAHYENPDNDPQGPWFPGNVSSPNPRPNLRFTIESPTGHKIPPPANGWRWGRDRVDEMIDSGEITFSPDGTRLIRKTYLVDQAGLSPSTVWGDIEETGHNRQAKYELKKLFRGIATAELFKTPKPERLLHRIIHIASKPGDIVLDCFLGSGTTAAVAHKMGRRWVGIEREDATIDKFTLPRLTKVVAGKDAGGVTPILGWKGGGSFRVLDVAPSMFEADEGMVFLAEWATNGALAEATAAQMGYDYAPEPPFCGRKGRTRLAVVDGVANEAVVRLLANALPQNERVVICGTGIDSDARAVLRELRRGSTLRKIPAALLDQYRTRRSRALTVEEEEAVSSYSAAVPVESGAAS